MARPNSPMAAPSPPNPTFPGSNYLLKMSDEPKGPWCRVWDGLFWSFIAEREEFLLGRLKFPGCE
jgi:deoxyribodipyrimidine photolyase-like uncharacterized protein